MKKLLPLLLILLLITPVYAQTGKIKLLAVTETNEGYEGKVADMEIEIIEGKGRVFLDTYPLTKFDTQIATRFAKQTSCDFLNVDCSNYDFIYTIKSGSGIIGGPSAGAATAVLTTAILTETELNPDVAITGTINAGNLIGPVSGLLKKIEAAAKNGIKTVLIPKGTRYIKTEDLDIKELDETILQTKNETELDLIEFGKKLNLEVIEVSQLGEAMEHFTEKQFTTAPQILEIDPNYVNTMQTLARQLCTRAKNLQQNTRNLELNNQSREEITTANELLKKSALEIKEYKFYAAASRCFSANIKYANIKKQQENITDEQLQQQTEKLLEEINQFNELLKQRQLNTIMDLQAFMIVKERLEEAKTHAENALNETSSSEHVYAVERFESSKAWSTFFDQPGTTYDMKEDSLKDSCLSKLEETEERTRYVGYFVPESLKSTTEDLKKAKQYADEGKYVLCLFKASKTKAEADSIYSIIGIPEHQIEEVIKTKLEVAEQTIAKEAHLNSFPILAYSYYEYTQQLLNETPYSALLYSQYALELANMRLYFNEKRTPLTLSLSEGDKLPVLPILFLGLFIGLLIGSYLRFNRK